MLRSYIFSLYDSQRVLAHARTATPATLLLCALNQMIVPLIDTPMLKTFERICK